MDGVRGVKLSDADRAEHWEWCRAYIDHHCILRCDRPLLVGDNGSLNTWQFYMPVATLNQEFGHRISLLFWDRYFDQYQRQPFQICGCETGAVPLLSLLQAAAYERDIAVNVFSMKKQAKAYGLKNWLEGIAYKELPVLPIDDVIGRAKTLSEETKRLADWGFTLHAEAFSILSCKAKRPITIKSGEREISVTVLYAPEDFVFTPRHYFAKYGRRSQFRGVMV